MAGNDSTTKGKTPTRAPAAEPDSDDERDNEIRNLKAIVKELQSNLNLLGGNYNDHAASVKDHLEQLHAQVVASAPATSVGAPKLPKAETFDGTRHKLRGFLTQMDIHIDVNKGRLFTEGSKVIFVSAYLRGQAWDWLEPHIREYYEKPSTEWSSTTQSIFNSYTTFRQHLERTFGDIDAKKTAERKLKRIRQTGSASTYTAEFMQLAAILQWEDYALIPYYDHGLKSHIKDELARIDRPDTMEKLIDVAVRIDNRLYDRQMEKREIEGWKKGNGRPSHHRYDKRPNRPSRDSDPYGPRPMELDAARLPAEEEKRRKNNNLCFECGKAGHRARECNNKRNNAKPWARERNNGRNNAKPQQLRATQDNEVRPQQLRATHDGTERLKEAIARATPDEYEHLKDQVTQWATEEPLVRKEPRVKQPRTQQVNGTLEEIIRERGLISAEHAEDHLENGTEQIESQGWTQHGPWDTIDSQELSDGSQEWGVRILETPIEIPRTPENPETPPQLPGTDTTEQPQENPTDDLIIECLNQINQVQALTETNLLSTDTLRQLIDILDNIRGVAEGIREEEQCPCNSNECACRGYARHPDHGLRTVSACYDDNCIVHYQGKIERSLEPKPLRWEKKPNWKPEYAGLWFGNRRINEQHLAATAWGTHVKITANIAFRPARVMVDSGASGNFMSPQYKQQRKIQGVEKPQPTPITGLNGESLGPGITHESGTLPMVIGDHFETINFDITPLGGYDVVLGVPWLKKHNPAIDWRVGNIVFDRCSCRQTSGVWTGKSEPIPLNKRPSSGGAGTHENPHEGELKRSFRPGGRPNKRVSDITDIAITEQRPDMTDTELEEYVLVNHEETALCATGSPEEKHTIPGEYREFQDVFTPPPDGELPEHGPFDHEIKIKDDQEPKFMPIYPLSQKESATLEEYIKDNLKKGNIQHSKSSAGYPILFVPKKGGELRMCVDYRQLNDITIKDRHPLPLINEIQDIIQGAKYFSKYDITNAYNRLRIKEGDEWKTAFRTKFGHFEYNVMPFGLTNAPASFQRFIFDVLKGYLDKFVIAYLDDILVFSKTKAEHVEHNKKVLQRLREAKVTLKLKKCEFHVQKTSFLGYTISPDGLGMEQDKVKSILEWPTPTCVKDVQSFLGLANYYRKLVPQYSKHAAGLYRFTKKGVPFEWDDEAEKSFTALKEMYNKPAGEAIVATFNYDAPIIIETDASDFALGAQLMQPGKDGKLRPVAFWSRKMIPAELNYDVHDKELLAIVSAFQTWRAYLEGAKHTVTVRTDHHNLTYFTTTKKLTRRQARYAETLAEYDFKIIHCKGTENAVADALSRRPDYELGTKEAVPAILTTDSEGNIVYNHQVLAATSELQNDEWLSRIREATDTDESIQKILGNNTALTRDGLVYIHSLVYVPGKLQDEIIQTHHDEPTQGHLGIEKTIEKITRNYYIPALHRKVKKYIQRCDSCQRNKPSRHAPYGEMEKAEVPTRPWEWITMDFITKLPISEGNDMIMVVVDRLTKYAYMIPTTETIDARKMANLLLRHVFANHGTPDKITSDRDKLFTSKMWQSLADQLGIEHRLSTAYHPQTNGQTERVNQTLEQYLRHYVNFQQDDWTGLLPMAQFAYNNAMHSTTKETPFFANYGLNPTIIGEPIGKQPLAESSRLLATGLKQLHLQLSRDIEFLNMRMKFYYDQSRQEAPEFQRGEKVYLLRRNIRTRRPSAKLDHLKLGPFEIEEKTGPLNYRLKLPESMRRIHATFHVSLLEKAPRNAEVATNVEIEEETENEYEVEEILATNKVSGKPHYLVKWRGYDTSENTWEPIENLAGCHRLVRQFHQQEKETQRPRPTKRRPGRPRKMKDHSTTESE
jgi:transposase InsO family protein